MSRLNQETAAAGPAGSEGLGRLMSLSTGYWASAALIASVELGLWEALAAGHSSVEDLAAACRCDEAHLADLLDALVALGLVERSGADFRPAADVAPLLDPRSPRSLLGALRLNADLYPVWARLAETIRCGRPVFAGSHLGLDPARTRRFVLAMESRARAMGDLMLAAVDVAAARRLLDVGAGSGALSRTLAERHPTLRVTQFDLPPVLAIARELAAASPAAGRIEFVEGDYRNATEFGGPYDAILYCGALHQESPSSAEDLCRRLRVCTATGGRLYVVDLMRQPGGGGPAMACLFSLNMRLTSPMGRVYAADEVEALVARAGWRVRTSVAAPSSPYRAIVAELGDGGG